MRETPIGFHGVAKSGKDTVANIAKRLIGHKAVKYSFADPIRKIGTVFGFTKGQMLNPELKEVIDPFWGVTWRWFAQTVGTEMFRERFREDCWVMLFKLFAQSNNDLICLVPDVRFDNEAESIRQMDGIVIHVVRESAGLKGDQSKHASEAGISGRFVNATIKNDGTLEDLVRATAAVLRNNRYLPSTFDLGDKTVAAIVEGVKKEEEAVKREIAA